MFCQSSKLAVSGEYICSLVDQANGKMDSNWARVQRFHELLAQPALQHSSAQPSAGLAHPEAAAGKPSPAGLGQEPLVLPLSIAVQSKQSKPAQADVSKLQSAMQGHSAQHDERSGAGVKPSVQGMPMTEATKRQHTGLKANVVRRLRALERRQKAVLTRVAALEDTPPGSEAADRALCWQRMLLSLEVRGLCSTDTLSKLAIYLIVEHHSSIQGFHA